MRTVTKHYHDIDTPNGGLALELPIKMSESSHEVLVHIADDVITLGYLAHDSDCANPLEEDEYMGAIYECRRHGSTLKEYEKALGLRDGGPDYSLVDEDKVVEAALAAIFLDDGLIEKALAHCETHWDRPTSATCANRFIEDCLDSVNELEPVIETDDFYFALWRQGREDGTIGAKHTVMLDVYEHGLISYCVSGQGMQCQFDTARGGAVWVPNENCLGEINFRAQAYRKGRICKGVKSFAVQHGEVNGVRESAPFDTRRDAFNYLLDPALPEIYNQDEAERMAAEELAAQAADTYTDWCNGNCYLTVTATFDLEGTPIDWDCCGGYIGIDNAVECLKYEFPKDPT